MPSLIPAIKEASDSLKIGQTGKFLLTGSADIFRSAKTSEALPGHLARLILFPLSLSEVARRQLNIVDFLLQDKIETGSVPFTSREVLAEWVVSGGYPEILNLNRRARRFWFDAYIEGRLLQDFLSIYTARGDFNSKLKALTHHLAGLCGRLLKYSRVASDLALNDKSVKSYIEALELMYVVHPLPAFVNNPAKRQVARMSKLHFVDTGLACSLLGIRDSEQLLNSQFYGGLLENFIYMELSKHAACSSDAPRMYHFRDQRQNEVDIVLESSDRRIIGIEVKASSTISSRDFKGLASLAEYSDSRFAHGVLFYTGERILSFPQGGISFYAVPIGMLFHEFEQRAL